MSRFFFHTTKSMIDVWNPLQADAYGLNVSEALQEAEKQTSQLGALEAGQV